MSRQGQKERSQSDWCDAETLIYRYRELLRWPIVTEADEIALSAGETVCSADLPVGLASEVQSTLRLRMLDGPVVLVPGRQHRWMLLATPSQEPSTAPAVTLPGVHLRVHTEGTIALPPSSTLHGPLRWVVPPSLSRPWLPPLSAIIAATRTAVSTG